MPHNSKTIVLDNQDTDFVDDQVRSGHFRTPGEVVHAGLRLLREEEARLSHLRALVDEADAQLERGEGQAFANTDDLADAVIKRGTERLRDEG